MNDSDEYDIDRAANDLYNFTMTWGRIGGQIKEKYGTLRFYVNFSYLSLHNLIYPGYHYYQFPRWLLWIDEKIIARLLSPLNGLYFRWQVFIYRRGYKLILDKYPNIREAILVCADYPEYLEGL